MPSRKKCEMWMSHNKVLMGNGNKAPHARNPNFETEETKLLISLWGDPKVQKTLITTHKKRPVIAKIADCMREHGYYRSPEEINTRIKNLKCFYNRIKKDMELGVINDPTWKHFDAMDEILTRPMFGSRLMQQQNVQQRQMLKEEDVAKRELRPEDLLTVEAAGEEVDVEDCGLIVPKDEPQDDEEMDIDGDNSSNAEILSSYMQRAAASDLRESIKSRPSSASSGQSTPTNMDKIKAVKKTKRLSPVPTEIKMTKAIALPKTTLTTTMTTNTPISTPNKISLVPTNILLKSNPQNISFKSPQIIYTKAQNTSTSLTTVQSGCNMGMNNKTMPMKLLLVNTLQKGLGQTATVVTATSQHQLQQQQLQQQHHQMQKQQKHQLLHTQRNKSPTSSMENLTAPNNGNGVRKGPWKFSKGTPGFRTLLNQLVQLQTQNLDVARERLVLEKQRFDFEKSVGEKLCDILPMFQQITNHFTKNNEQN